MIPRTLFTPEHETFRDSVRRFMQEEVMPHDERWQEQGFVDKEVWKKAGANGFLCCTMPEEYGGAGADRLYSVVLMEEQARANNSSLGWGLHSEIVAQAMMKSVGNWTTTNRIWMQPGTPPSESARTATVEGLLEGRFVMETNKTTMMGMPWEGRGSLGYDNTAKKHVGTWFDSFGTMMMYFEGTCEGACKVITMTSDFMDPLTKTMKKMKIVSKEIGPDENVTTMFDVAKDGTETKMGEVTYKRKK